MTTLSSTRPHSQQTLAPIDFNCMEITTATFLDIFFNALQKQESHTCFEPQ